jgi:PAS domain S-box-containing protein
MAPAKKKEQQVDNAREVREAAEKQSSRIQGTFPGYDGQTPEQLIQELQVHQIELETQAEELRRVQHELEKSRYQYIDLYDCAPVGYLTLNEKTIVTSANLTAATLLGAERRNLINHGFGHFIDQDCLDIWDQYFLTLCRVAGKQVITLTIRRGDGTTFPARLEGTRFSSESSSAIIRMVISDISDIVKVQEKLREREAMVRALMDSPVDSVVILDMNGIIIDANETLARKHNLTVETMRGRNVYDLVPPDLAASRRSRIEEVARTGTEARFQDRRADYWYDNSVYPIPDTTGNITRIAIVARDITGLKRMEDELLASHHRLESAMEAGNIAWWEMDCSTGKVSFNERKARMLGYPADHFSHYSDFTTLLHPDDYEPTMQAMRDHLSGITKNYEADYRIRTNTGDYRWFHDVGGISAYDQGGAPLRVTGIVMDITGRKKAEEALREHETQYRSVVENANEGIVVAQDGVLMFANPKAQEMIQSTPENILCKPFIAFIHPDDRDLVADRYKRRLEGENVPSQYDFRVVGVEGRLTWVQISAVFITWMGKPATLNFLTDITERKDSEEKLQFANTLLSTQAESSIDGILVVDESGKIISCNRRFLEVWEIPDEVISSGSDEKAIQAILGNLVDPEEFVSKVRYLYSHRDQKSRDEIFLRDGRILDRYTAPMTGSAGEYYGRIWNFRDITTEKQVQKSLKAAVDWLKMVQRDAKAGFWGWDFPTGKLTWSEEFYELFGLPLSAEPSFDTWLAVLHPDDRADALERIEQSVKERKDLWNEYRIILKHGEERWIGASGRTSYEETGKARYMSGICLDITERKRLDTALEESEQRYRGLIDGVPDYILVHRNGKILFVNPAALKVIGDEGEDLVGSDIMRYIAPESRPLVVAMMTKRSANELLPPYEITIIPRSGVKRVTEVHGALIMYQGVPASLNVLSDITERKRAEEALKESEERYRSLVFGAGIGVGYWSPEGKLLFLNEISLKRLKGKEEDFIGKNMRELFGEDEEHYLERLKKAVASPDPLEYEDYASLPAGKSWYLSVYSRIKGQDGSVKGVQVLSIDISDRKLAEQLQERLFSDIQQKNIELERFTYTVSHDLKSPLITIKGFLGYLEKDALAGDIARLHEDIARIHAATSKMEDFITSLLELSRVGRVVNPPVSVSLEFLVLEAVEALYTEIEQRGIRLIIPDDLPEVFGDKVRLQQVMTNLIGNAVKFMGDQKEPVIEIRASHNEGEVLICVQDNGTGIAPENLDKIFSVFTRLNPAIPGAGIGLALVRRIVEVHGGTCRVESAGLGQGSTFCFSLPEKPQNDQ